MSYDRIEIFASKKKSIKVIFYAACLIALSIFVVMISEDQTMVPVFVAKLIGYLSLLLFIPSVLYLLYRLSDNSPKIILDSSGITDRSSATSAGFIPWKEIKEFQPKKVHSVSLLGIVLKDSDYFLKSLTPFSRFMNKLNGRLYSSSFLISTDTLEIDFEEFNNLVLAYHKKFSG